MNQKIANKDIKNFLKGHNIKPTLIRVKILEYLWNTREHPDADMIFEEISKFIPTLSKASVYNTLNLFLQHNIIQEIKIENEQIRYDGFTGRHAHFKCIKCGKLIDVELECKDCRPLIKGKILQEHIYFVGICEECLK